MASKKASEVTSKNADDTSFDPDLMEGLDEWDDNEGDDVEFGRFSFKPDKVGPGAVLRGIPVSLQPITSVFDGKEHKGDAVIMVTTRPARLTDSEGVTKVHPKGTIASIYCTMDLEDIKPFIVAKRCVEFGFKVLKRERTGSGNTFQPVKIKLMSDKVYEREEVKAMAIGSNETLKKLMRLVGLENKALTNGTPSNPVLPQ